MEYQYISYFKNVRKIHKLKKGIFLNIKKVSESRTETIKGFGKFIFDTQSFHIL